MEDRNNFHNFYNRFKKHRLAHISLYVLVCIIALILVLPLVLELDPYAVDPLCFKTSPGIGGHLLGTDDVGRDLLARLIYGGRVTLAVALCAPLISVSIGLPLGLLAGYYRGIVETLVLRTADIFMSFPSMILMIVVMSILEPTVYIIILVIGVVGWPSMAKLVYGNVISVRKMDYIEAAKATGIRDSVILWKYVLPNSITPVWVQLAFSACFAVMNEAALSFLGCGVRPPTPSWGNIIYAAQNVTILEKCPWIWLPSGIMLMLTVICINFIGEGIRDALDPRLKR